MTWTTPRTWVVGETLTAALLNTHVRDNELDIDSRLDVIEAASYMKKVGEDTAEHTTTTSGDLSQVTGLSIPTTSGIRVEVEFRKSSGAAAGITVLQIYLNNSGASASMSSTATTDSANSAGSGIAQVDFGPYDASYVHAMYGRSRFSNAVPTITTAVWTAGAARANATTTQVTVAATSGSGSVTVGTKNLRVYELP